MRARSPNQTHWGTTLDECLDADCIRGTAKADSLTRIIAWQLTQEMQRQGLTKATLAERMHTSRAQLDCILKAHGNVTIETLHRAAALLPRTPPRANLTSPDAPKRKARALPWTRWGRRPQTPILFVPSLAPSTNRLVCVLTWRRCRHTLGSIVSAA